MSPDSLLVDDPTAGTSGDDLCAIDKRRQFPALY